MAVRAERRAGQRFLVAAQETGRLKQSCLPFDACQRPAVTGPAVTTQRWSGLNDAPKTGPMCPRRRAVVLPVATSQMRAS